MGILDFFKVEPRTLTLDVATMHTWPEKLVKLQKLDRVLSDLQRSVEQCRHAISAHKARLTHPSLRAELDERLVPIHDEHVPIVIDAIDDLLDEINLDGDVFEFVSKEQVFAGALSDFRSRMQRSEAALRELHGDELRELDEVVRGLEDALLSGRSLLDEGRLASIENVKAMIQKRGAQDERREQLLELKSQMEAKLIILRDKREKIMAKIDHYMERSTDAKYQEIFAVESELRRKREDIRAQELTADDEARLIRPIDERLVLLRKQMMHDITALNISEQRAFLEATNDDLRKVKKNLAKIESALHELSMEQFLNRLREHLDGFNVRIEDAATIYEEDVDVISE